jgi:hypothetical protein
MWGVTRPLPWKTMETLRDHFRRLTMVRGPDRRRLLFRFYDTRVSRVFLPTGANLGTVRTRDALYDGGRRRRHRGHNETSIRDVTT